MCKTGSMKANGNVNAEAQSVDVGMYTQKEGERVGANK